MTISSSGHSPEVRTASFPDMATRSLSELRSAITQMFAEIPGGVRKSYDVNKMLGVDARLSWQIFKLTGPGDALTLAPHVPAPGTMQRLLTAATKHGISAERVAAARQAFDAFEHLVEQHAGDRSVFDTMTRSLGEDDEISQQADVNHRKAMFKGQRHYMAVELDSAVNTFFHYPTGEPGIVDIGGIRSKLGMRRLRSDAEMIVDNPRMWTSEDGDKLFNTFDPGAVGGKGAGLLTEFCTYPLPPLKSNIDADGQRAISLAGETIGRKAQIDLVFGNIWRGVPLLSPDANGTPGFGLHVYITYPTSHFYMDIAVPREIFWQLKPSLEVYGLAPSNGSIEDIRRKHPKLAFREKIARIVGGIDAAQIREMPQYLTLVKSFCAQMKRSAEDLEIFRLYLEYPIVGSLVSLRFNVSASQ